MSILGQFQFRRDLAANWSSVNPILLSGELGIESDTDLFKLGDGVTAWNALPYGGLQGTPGVASMTTVGATTVINPNQNPSVTDADPGNNADLRFNLPRAIQFNAISANTVPSNNIANVNTLVTPEGDLELEFSIPRGANGWSPILANVTDGERRVLRLVDWTGGEGTKPTVPTDNYIGAAGFTNLAGATDIRGATGATGPAANSFVNIAVTGQTTVSAEQANDTLTLVGSGVTITTDAANDTVTFTNADRGSQQNIFKNIAVSGQSTVVADNNDDTLTLVGSGVTITTDAANDTVTFTNADRGSQQNIFKNIAVSGQNTVVADNNDDTLTLVGSGSITITTDPANDTVTISGAVAAPQNCFAVVTGNTGTASADLPADTLAITGGTGISTAATDTPDGLVITNTGVTSVNGQTGAVTIPVMTVSTLNAPTASFSTVVTTVISQPITGGSIAAGSMFQFRVRAQVINTTATSNLVATISIGATNVLVQTQALGATARAAPGQPVIIEGTISFSSATAAEATSRAFTSSAVAFDTGAATSAAVTVVTAANTTADIKLNTSAATSTVIVREASIVRIK